MEEFELILEQYEPMITSILKRAHVYKNHEHFRQSARIALWKAWQNYNPERGPFAPYAYRTMQTTIYTEMKNENNYSDHQIAYERDKLTATAQIMEDRYHQTEHELGDILDTLKELLNEKEIQLIVDLYINGYSYEDLCNKYGVTIYALRKRRDRIIQKIRSEIG